MISVFCRNLSAALTEDLGELRSEKNLLLASLAYTEEDAALNEYAGLRQQAQKEYQTFQKKKSGQERQFLSHSH